MAKPVHAPGMEMRKEEDQASLTPLNSPLKTQMMESESCLTFTPPPLQILHTSRLMYPNESIVSVPVRLKEAR